MSAGPTPDMPRKLSDPATWLYFPASEAFYCEQCRIVFNIGDISTECPACASKAIMSLAAVLGREEEKEGL